jgi:cell wall integrity and stress response component
MLFYIGGGKDAFTVIQAVENIGAPVSGASTTIAATASTAAGGIIVAPSTAAAPTGIVTALASTNTKSAESGSSKSTVSESGATSSSPSPSPTFNAAGTVRAGSSLIGAVIAGMGLLL